MQIDVITKRHPFFQHHVSDAISIQRVRTVALSINSRWKFRRCRTHGMKTQFDPIQSGFVSRFPDDFYGFSYGPSRDECFLTRLQALHRHFPYIAELPGRVLSDVQAVLRMTTVPGI